MLRLIRSYGVAIASALSIALLSTVATAQARLSAPIRVSPLGLFVQESAAGVGGGRTAVLMAGYVNSAGTRKFSLQARLGHGARLGGVQCLARAASSPRVAIGADGTVVAAWIERTRRSTRVLRVAVARPGHDFARAQTLSQARSMTLGGVGVTPTGRVVLSWRRGVSGTPVQVAVAAPGQRFATQTLGASRYYAPALAVAPEGTVLVAWLEVPEPPLPPPAPPQPVGTARMLVSTLPQGAVRFGSPARLATLSHWVHGPEAASGPGGAAVSWRDTTEKKLVSLTSAGLQPAVPLPASTYAVEQGDHLALGIPADGSTVALWRDVRTRTAEDPTLTYAAVKSSVRPPGGAFSPTEQISPSGRLAGPPRAAALTDRTVAAWSESGGPGARVRIAVHPLGRGWTAPAPLPAPRIDTSTVSVAASSGYAAITWVQRPRSARSGQPMYLASYRP